MVPRNSLFATGLITTHTQVRDGIAPYSIKYATFMMSQLHDTKLINPKMIVLLLTSRTVG